MKITKLLNIALLTCLVLGLGTFIIAELVMPYTEFNYETYYTTYTLYKFILKIAVLLLFVSLIFKEKNNGWKTLKKYPISSSIIICVFVINVITYFIFHSLQLFYFFIFAIPFIIMESEKGVAKEYNEYKKRSKKQKTKSK